MRKTAILYILAVVVMSIVVAGCVKKRVDPSVTDAGVYYNKYNIHAFSNGKDIKASYANWIGPEAGHIVIPPNTPFIVQPWARGFLLVNQSNQQKIFFEYDAGHMMGLSGTDYVNLIFSQQPVSISGLSALDRDGVEKGQALKGMSREGVMTALGYPAKSATPSLETDRWYYWQNRFKRFVVVFDKSGKVTDIQR